MNAQDFIKENYPVTAIQFENKTCLGLNDVAYICEKYHENEVKKLNIPDVSNRRELLIAFAKFVEEEYWDNKGVNDAVDTFIRTKGN